MLKIKSKLSVMDEDCGNSPNFMLNVKKSIEKWATSLKRWNTRNWNIPISVRYS